MIDIKNDDVWVLVNEADGNMRVFQCKTKTRLNPCPPFGGWKIVENDWCEREPLIENFVEEIATQWEGQLSIANARIVDKSEVPAGRSLMREYRGAWTHDFGIDMPKAREIHKDKLRKMRKPMLEALDLEYQKADENGDKAKKSDITAQKQVLRDITNHPGIEVAATLDELKAVTI